MLRSKEATSQGIAHNALSQGTVIKGNMFVEGDLRIDGRVEGNIACNGKLVLGPKGEIQGNINCDSAELMGKTMGDLHAKSNVSLKQTANFQGAMIVHSINIEPGAAFNGTCKMMND